jgi:hypothetical protein
MPLDLGNVIRIASAIPWANKRAFARALAVPFVLTALLEPAWQLVVAESPTGWHVYLLLCLQSLIYTVFAVICHRLVLLGANDEVSRLMPRWSWRETRFLLWGLALWGGVMIFTAGIAFGATFTMLRDSGS